MKTAEEKLNYADWLHRILDKSKEDIMGVALTYKNTNSSYTWNISESKHPRVKQFHKRVEQELKLMRTDIQAELEAMFK